MAANVLDNLVKELAQHVGGEDVARGIMEGFQMQKGATRSTVQKQMRNVISNIQTDDAIRQARFADQFSEGVGGQMTIKGLESPSSVMDDAVEQVAANTSDAVPGQMSMFPDSTGQMQASGIKIQQIKEARRARLESRISEGSDGQMFMNFGNPNTPEPVVSSKAVSEVASEASNGPIDGQMSFTVNNRTNEVDMPIEFKRQQEVNKANRNWIQRRLDGGKDAISAIKTSASETISGTGDASRRVRGRKTREVERQAANARYVETGEGSAQSKKDFYRNYDRTSQNQEDTYRNIFDPADVADANSKSGAGFFSGIGEWVDNNKFLAGSIAVGGLVIGSELLEDDY